MVRAVECTSTFPALSRYATLPISHLAVLYDLHLAAAEAMNGVSLQPRCDRVAGISETIDAVETVIASIVDELDGRVPATQTEAERLYDILVSYWGRRCNDYDKASATAVRLLPMIARSETTH